MSQLFLLSNEAIYSQAVTFTHKLYDFGLIVKSFNSDLLYAIETKWAYCGRSQVLMIIYWQLDKYCMQGVDRVH